MLGNWSFGDYFKEQSIPWGWELSTEGFGFDPERIWVTVFEGDEELGLGPDDEAIEIWRGDRRPRGADRRRCRARRTSGRPAPPGPAARARRCTSTAARSSAGPDDRPGDDTDRFLEYWNHVFMTYDLAEDGDADRAADEEHRHRHGARADGGDPPGRRLGLRDRRAAAAGRAGRGALGPLLRRRAARPRARCGSSPTTPAGPRR